MSGLFISSTAASFPLIIRRASIACTKLSASGIHGGALPADAVAVLLRRRDSEAKAALPRTGTRYRFGRRVGGGRGPRTGSAATAGATQDTQTPVTHDSVCTWDECAKMECLICLFKLHFGAVYAVEKRFSCDK